MNALGSVIRKAFNEGFKLEGGDSGFPYYDSIEGDTLYHLEFIPLKVKIGGSGYTQKQHDQHTHDARQTLRAGQVREVNLIDQLDRWLFGGFNPVADMCGRIHLPAAGITPLRPGARQKGLSDFERMVHWCLNTVSSVTVKASLVRK